MVGREGNAFTADQFLEVLSDLEEREREVRELKEAKVVISEPYTAGLSLTETAERRE
jgi:hypothetical protein